MLDSFFAEQGSLYVPFSVRLYDSTMFLVYDFLYLNLKTRVSVCIGKHHITSQRIVKVKQIKPEKYHDESNTKTQQIQYVDGLLEIGGMSNNTTENLK